MVSTGLLILMSLYLFLNSTVLVKLFNNKVVVLWVVTLFVFPVVLNFLHDVILQKASIYEYCYSSLNTFSSLCIFLMGCVFIINHNDSYIHKVLNLILITIVISFILNVIFPKIFIGMAILQGRAQFENVDELGRLFGLYIQSNFAALALLALLPLILYSQNFKSPLYSLLVIVIIQALILSTGSRSGIAIGFLFLLIYGIKLLYQALKRHSRLNLEASVTVFFLGGIALLIISLLFINLLSQKLKSNQLYSENIHRIERLFADDKNSGISNDGSFKARKEAQIIYLQKILSNPFGYGNSGKKLLFESGEITHVSHNLYIETTFKYGFSYLMFLLFTLVFSWHRMFNRTRPNNVLSSLFIIILIYGIAMSGILSRRALVLSLGMSIGFYLIKTNRIFQHNRS